MAGGIYYFANNTNTRCQSYDSSKAFVQTAGRI